MARVMLSSKQMRSIGFLVVLAVLWCGVAGSALAQVTQPGASTVAADNRANRIAAEHHKGLKAKRPRRGEQVPVQQVPELDPNAAGLALALLVGGALLLSDRRRYLRAQ